MDRFETMRMFVAVADKGSFAAAARDLRTSPPAMTRGIAALEGHLGVVLFHRSTRAVSLTDEGSIFLDKAKRVLADLADAERALHGAQAEPRGQLFVTAPVFFGRLHVLPVVTQLLETHADLSIRMMLVDRNVRIVEEGIDLAVRIGPLTDSSLKAVRIGSVRQMIVASPAYLARNAPPVHAKDLARHTLIASSGPRAAGEWRFGKERNMQMPVQPRLITNTVDSALAAAEAGVGLANLLSYQTDDAVRSGRLIEVLKDLATAPVPVHLLFEASRSSLPSTRAFIDAMRAHGRAQNWEASM
jgi:DNA-binding transcriptional LysR family regulator